MDLPLRGSLLTRGGVIRNPPTSWVPPYYNNRSRRISVRTLFVGVCASEPSCRTAHKKWRQRDSNPRSLRCERSAFPAKLCPRLTSMPECLCIKSPAAYCGRENGDNRARTCDPMRVMHVLSQLSYASVHYSTTFSRKCNSFFIFLYFFYPTTASIQNSPYTPPQSHISSASC